MMSAARKALFRSLLRELRSFDGEPGCAGAAWRAGRAALTPQTLGTLLGNDGHDGDSVFTRSVLYRPSLQLDSVPKLGDSRNSKNGHDFRSRVRQQLRASAASNTTLADTSEVDAAIAAATVSASCTAAKLPFPFCKATTESESFSSTTAYNLVLHSDEVKAGDLLLAHPYLTDEGLGGCVGVVIRHSELDTLALILNVDACVDVPTHHRSEKDSPPVHEWSSLEQNNRPSWRLHVYLPPLSREDPRRHLPKALRRVPLRWGGPYPVPLHLLHTVPLNISSNTSQKEPFQRLSGHKICPGLWCSFVDENTVKEVTHKLENRSAEPANFGAFIGMMCLEPGRLESYIQQNHWLILRPAAHNGMAIPVQGWGGPVQVTGTQWLDDRNWMPWRSILRSLGGEFEDWANINWTRAMQSEQNFRRDYCVPHQVAMT